MDINSHKLGRRAAAVRSSLLQILGPVLRLLSSFFSERLSQRELQHASCSTATLIASRI
jgi:hypothetical protein